jgi:hypothetical protein
MGWTKQFWRPQNSDNNNGWKKLWHLVLHCVGVIVEVVLEVYYIMDQDVKKDSNLGLTVLALALGKTLEQLWARGISMPEHLSLTYDNMAQEWKNQQMAEWIARLVLTGCCQSAQESWTSGSQWCRTPWPGSKCFDCQRTPRL